MEWKFFLLLSDSGKSSVKQARRRVATAMSADHTSYLLL